MMNKNSFFTEIKIPQSPFSITHKDNILLFGSCFTDEIGAKLSQNGFNILKNPFGILYNPKSIEQCIYRIAKRDYFEAKDTIKSGEYYYLFSAHGDFRGLTQEECLSQINQSIDNAHTFLEKSNVVIITLGTAWTYWYKENNYLMGNCHKIDSKLIERKLLTNKDISEAIINIGKIISDINPTIRIIFTLSPVRHWREGFRDNAVSKARLYDAIYQNTDNKQVFYFPSYDIVMDELRDYRFYAKDLLHVGDVAVDYIWQKFSEVYFSPKTMEINDKFVKLYQMKNHRPFNPQSEGFMKHLTKIKSLEEELNTYMKNLKSNILHNNE